MKYCTNCGMPLQDDSVNFCSNCGVAQQPVKNSPEKNETGVSALNTLSILTILGSVLGIIKGLFVESMQSATSEWLQKSDYMLGYLAVLANVGTLTGAIYMLNRRKAGYTIYVISEVACIILSLIGTLNFTNPGFDGSHVVSIFSVFLASMFVVPSLVFIILYTVLVKKHLK